MTTVLIDIWESFPVKYAVFILQYNDKTVECEINAIHVINVFENIWYICEIKTYYNLTADKLNYFQININFPLWQTGLTDLIRKNYEASSDSELIQ